MASSYYVIINPLGKGKVDFPNLLNVVNLN